MNSFLFQTICTNWTKKSRGSPQSIKRNSSPEALILPTSSSNIVKNLGWIYWHKVSYDEPEFKPQIEMISFESKFPSQFFDTVIFLEDKHLKVELFSRKELKIPSGVLGRIVYNSAREIVEEGWVYRHYRKVVLNMFWNAKWSSNVFLREPAYCVRRMKDLN